MPYPLGAPPASWAPWQVSGAHLLLYEVFRPGKNQKEAFGTKRRRLEAELGQEHFCSPASDYAVDTSLRKGEIEAVVITNNPLIMGGPIFINIFTNTISYQTPIHLLYSIFVSKPQIGTCGLLVVFITSCS